MGYRVQYYRQALLDAAKLQREDPKAYEKLKKLETELLHCILAHQGQLEYGSPKKPSIMEALALYYADDTDAKLEIMIEEFQNSNSTGFLGLNRFLGTNIRKTSQEE